MNIIVVKARLVDAPTPPFIGTRIAIRTSDAQRTFGICTANLDSGHDAVTVDWGDGTIETLTSLNKVTHDYAASGEYEVKISDDIRLLSVSASMNGSPFYDEYPKLVVRVCSNAQNLVKTGMAFLARSSNLTSVDMSESAITTFQVQTFAYCPSLTTCHLPKGITALGTQAFRSCTGLTRFFLPPGITQLTSMTFRDCTSLAGEISLPFINDISATETNEPFAGCTGVTAIHFAAANESTIRASTGYQADPTLGTGTATCVFDL